MLCSASSASGHVRSTRRLRLRSTNGRPALTSAAEEASACNDSEATALFSEPWAWTDKPDWRKCMHPHRPIQGQIPPFSGPGVSGGFRLISILFSYVYREINRSFGCFARLRLLGDKAFSNIWVKAPIVDPQLIQYGETIFCDRRRCCLARREDDAAVSRIPCRAARTNN